MGIELLKLDQVLRGSERLARTLRTFDCGRRAIEDLHARASRLIDSAPLYVVDDQLDALPAAQLIPLATDMRRVSLAMWLGGRWELYDVAAIFVDGEAYVDQPQWNRIYGMPAFDE